MRRWATGAKVGADYVQGLWARLNGTALAVTSNGSVGAWSGPLQDLPWPRANPEARAGSITHLSHSIDALEKRLQEASKVCRCCLFMRLMSGSRLGLLAFNQPQR